MSKTKRSKYPTWQRRHEAVLIFLLKNPSAKLVECAKATGYSETHISRIINSPDFKELFNVALNQEITKAAYKLISGVIVVDNIAKF